MSTRRLISSQQDSAKFRKKIHSGMFVKSIYPAALSCCTKWGVGKAIYQKIMLKAEEPSVTTFTSAMRIFKRGLN